MRVEQNLPPGVYPCLTLHTLTLQIHMGILFPPEVWGQVCVMESRARTTGVALDNEHKESES